MNDGDTMQRSYAVDDAVENVVSELPGEIAPASTRARSIHWSTHPHPPQGFPGLPKAVKESLSALVEMAGGRNGSRLPWDRVNGDSRALTFPTGNVTINHGE